MVICSDVIYPAGDVNDYVDGFYVPYEGYPAADLRVCRATTTGTTASRGSCGISAELAGVAGRAVPVDELLSARAVGAAFFWRRPSAPQARPADGAGAERAKKRGERWASPSARPVLRDRDYGPGASGLHRHRDRRGDRPRAGGVAVCTWLGSTPTIPNPPTGKPLIVDGEYKPGRVAESPAPGEAARTVDRIVRDPELNFVGAIGGDIHNYQRYTVELGDFLGDPPPNLVEEPTDALVEDPDRLQYIVSGGGGASFTSPTHPISPRPLHFDGEDADAEAELRVRRFACYPSRDGVARVLQPDAGPGALADRVRNARHARGHRPVCAARPRAARRRGRNAREDPDRPGRLRRARGLLGSCSASDPLGKRRMLSSRADTSRRSSRWSRGS